MNVLVRLLTLYWVLIAESTRQSLEKNWQGWANTNRKKDLHLWKCSPPCVRNLGTLISAFCCLYTFKDILPLLSSKEKCEEGDVALLMFWESHFYNRSGEHAVVQVCINLLCWSLPSGLAVTALCLLNGESRLVHLFLIITSYQHWILCFLGVGECQLIHYCCGSLEGVYSLLK